MNETHRDLRRDDIIPEVIAEFSQSFASARTRWAKFAEEVHPELRGLGMMILQRIARQEPVTATELGATLDMDKAAISRHLAKLRSLGMVEAKPADEDRRVVLLTTSELARETLERMRRRNGEHYRTRFSEWSDDELVQLRELLHRFNAGEQQHGGAAGQASLGPAARCAKHAAN